VAAALDRDQLRLYTLIWQRTVATQMAQARFNQVGVDIDATAGPARYRLRATGRTMIFDGHLRVYAEGRDDGTDEDGERRLPELSAEQALSLLELLPGAALHAAAPALLRGVPRQGARGARHRQAVDLRVDHLDHPGPRLRPARGPPVLPQRRR
jgi:hypothetical protein